MRVLLSIAALASLLVAACSSTTGPAAVASSPAVATPPAQVAASEPAASVPPRAITEDGAFDEGPGSRDPFRAFAATPTPAPEDTRPRKARRVPVDQLKLVALVTHTATPRAMLVDANGKGYIVTQGELVGRPEPAADGARFASFRVDRIREGDVVLVREDPSRTGNPGATRVLALPREPLLQADD
jgi:type IV pilus assembly protein PilP